MKDDGLIQKHGGYRRLKSFQVSQLVFDLTVRFCERDVDRRSRTHDQMVQAARSGVQNIAEGSQASATSKKTELKLTSVARASLEELRLDYEDFLRQRGLSQWPRSDPRRSRLIERRPGCADDVAQWAKEVFQEQRSVAGSGGRSGRCGQSGLSGQVSTSTSSTPSTASTSSTPSTASTPSTYPEIAANGALVLIAVATALLDRQIDALARAFEREGGFTERLYRVRNESRRARH